MIAARRTSAPMVASRRTKNLLHDVLSHNISPSMTEAARMSLPTVPPGVLRGKPRMRAAQEMVAEAMGKRDKKRRGRDL